MTMTIKKLTTVKNKNEVTSKQVLEVTRVVKQTPEGTTHICRKRLKCAYMCVKILGALQAPL